MKLLSLRWAPFALLALTAAHPALADGFRLDVEAGPVWQTRNVFAVPGTTGTRVSLADYDEGPFASGRATLTWDVSPRWSARFVAAPLALSVDFTPTSPVFFAGTTFPAGEPLNAGYRFNSWRLSGYYRFPSSSPLSLRLGLTAKIRDARIDISGAGGSAEKSDTGFVPLIYAGARWQVAERFAVDLEADALGAPQGRAIDVSLKGDWAVSRTVSLYAGGRVLDGGADNDEVYSFATLWYGFAGVGIRF
ncbi:MAG: hypothetical protein IPL89_16040 [Acidobacteria bacterium]|nr:hypothetical protein [Acidobacteriota bacterium]